MANVLPGVGGRLLIDLHAFALARRGLVKFLLSEIRAFYNGDLTASIFKMRDDGMLEVRLLVLVFICHCLSVSR